MQNIDFSFPGKLSEFFDELKEDFGLQIASVNVFSNQDTKESGASVTLRNPHTGALVIVYPNQQMAAIGFAGASFMEDGQMTIVVRPNEACFTDRAVLGALIRSFTKAQAAQPRAAARGARVVFFDQSIPQA